GSGYSLRLVLPSASGLPSALPCLSRLVSPWELQLGHWPEYVANRCTGSPCNRAPEPAHGPPTPVRPGPRLSLPLVAFRPPWIVTACWRQSGDKMATSAPSVFARMCYATVDRSGTRLL